MTQFDNVSVVQAGNTYFDGKVNSRTVLFADGTKKTLGFMQPGEYQFGTAQRELMEIITGDLLVRLPGEDSWAKISGGGQFEVPADSQFSVRVETVTDYCCSYLAD